MCAPPRERAAAPVTCEHGWMVSARMTYADGGADPVWEVVIGERFAVAVSTPVVDGTCDALSALTHTDPQIEELVAVIGLDGSERSFAVLHWDEHEPDLVTVIVRGSAVVEVLARSGQRRIEARGIRPWHLAEVREVQAVRIFAVPPPPSSGQVSSAASPQVLPEATRTYGATGRVFASVVEWATATPAWTQTVPHVTIAAPPPRHSRGSPTASYRIADGPALSLRDPVLIGRTPRRAAAVRDEAVELVPVVSPSGTVSGTHLELRIEGDRIVATDLRSTNGTVLEWFGTARRLRSGESSPVGRGALLRLGQDTIIEILSDPMVAVAASDESAKAGS